MESIIYYKYPFQMGRIFVLAFIICSVLTRRIEHDSTKADGAWEHFKSSFSVRVHQHEEEYRRLVFEHNLATIEAHNADPTQTYKMGVNHFAIYTQKEFVHLFLSPNHKVPVVKNVFRSHIRKQKSDTHEQFIDWDMKGMVGNVKNQGQCKASWAFAAVAVVESFFKFKGNSYDLAEQLIIDCSPKSGTSGCIANVSLEDAMNYIKVNGTVMEYSYPYKAKNQTCVKIQGPIKINAVKSAVGCNGLLQRIVLSPIAVSVNANTWSLYRSGVFTSCTSVIPNHNVLLVGVMTGVWRIKNSWGTSWGEVGFMRLQSGNTCGICQSPGYYPA